MSRREPPISTRRNDLPVFPTEPPPAVPSTRTILRRFAAALTCRVAGRRRYKLIARFHPLTRDQLVYPNGPPRIGPLLTAKGVPAKRSGRLPSVILIRKCKIHGSRRQRSVLNAVADQFTLCKGKYVTSDHRVAGSSPAGCKWTAEPHK
jgi:hypothetical protein